MKPGSHRARQPMIGAALSNQPVRAAGFIVTLFGDVVVPRGGEVWIGNIIETCAGVGISETLVRTAVSRLVAAGKLEGRRAGRRGFYRLAGAAEGEFLDAARAIYGGEPGGEAGGAWHFIHVPDGSADTRMAQLERAGFARIKPQLAVGPGHLPVPDGVLVFRASPAQGAAYLREFAASNWDLASHARAYADFRARLDRFARQRAVSGAEASGAEALTRRLLLVHAYRHVLLRDPRLPAAALPADWPGIGARQAFAREYLALSEAADSHVADRFAAVSGPLAGSNTQVKARRAALAAVLLRNGLSEELG